MPDTLRELKRKSLGDQLDMLKAQFTAAHNQLLTTLDPSSQVRLQRQIEGIERQIADAETQLAALDTTSAPPGSTGAAPNRRALRDALASRFTLEELATLCDNLEVDIQNIPGDTLQGKAREIVQYFEHRGRLAELAAEVRAQRPGAGV